MKGPDRPVGFQRASVMTRLNLISLGGLLLKGASINHVNIRREGCYPNNHFTTKTLFCKNCHEGEGESKLPKNLTTWFMDGPMLCMLLHPPKGLPIELEER